MTVFLLYSDIIEILLVILLKDNPDLMYRLQFFQERLSTSIEFSKERYYGWIANRLNNTQKSSKN